MPPSKPMPRRPPPPKKPPVKAPSKSTPKIGLAIPKSPYRPPEPRTPLQKAVSSGGTKPSFASNLSKYGIKITPGGPGVGPVVRPATVSHPTPASQAAAYEAAAQRGYYTPPVQSGGGGGEALPTAGAADATIKPIHDVKWKAATFNLQNANAPSWWKPLIPQDAKDAERPDVQFLMMLNTMIPYLSPEDQRNAAAQIYSSAADAFSYYKPDKIETKVPVSEQTKKLSQQAGLTTIDQNYFQSQARATGAIDALSQMREQTVQGNRWKLGPGYTWLQQVLGTAGGLGGTPGAGQTRSQYLAQQGALDPLLAQAGTAELGGIGAVGRMFSQPFFSQQALRPTMQGPGGRTFFGQPSGLLAF